MFSAIKHGKSLNKQKDDSKLIKKIALLGSTGSIGVNTLNIVREFPERFKITALTANSNVEIIAKQIVEFNPQVAVVGTNEAYIRLKAHNFASTQILCGEEGLLEVARENDYDIFANALVGFAGLKPTVEAIKRSKRIALANKETLVVAGELINKHLAEYKSELLPIDSEHSAIFQCLVGEERDNVENLILTASGGPFRNFSLDDLQKVTVEQALNHPNWKMGKKITIDSATLMNKGLEVIEARWLFDIPAEKIQVVTHPQSIIHSMVEYCDGSIKAQMCLPDMKLPILYALSYPERLKYNFKTQFPKLKALTFEEPNLEKFECLKIAYEVLKIGGLSACIMNAANEIAVHRFLKNEIKFLDIPKIIKTCLDKIKNVLEPKLEDIYACDSETRRFARNIEL